MIKKNQRNIFSIIFLIMMVGSVFSTNIDPNRIVSEKQVETNGCTIYLASSDSEYLHNRGDGCYTIKLSESAVRDIWNDIIVKGFTIDRVESNIDATLDREKLIQNELLLKDPNATVGDMAMKAEMPNMLMNPLETSALLAQSCEGSFQFGLDLDTTLRVGRCEDSAAGCYTRNFGLFRQNGLTGFFPEMFSVGKDFLDAIGINKAKELAGEIVSGESSEYNIELGPFSDASIAELNHYKNLLESNDVNEMNIQGLRLITDKAISNVIETGSFSASMETTGRTENTVISSYSLFDKMFNQYYSTDMILSSSRILLGATTNRLMRSPAIKNIYENYTPYAWIKNNSFLGTMFKNPADLLLNTKGTIAKSALAAKKSRAAATHLKNITEHGSAAFGIKGKAEIQQMIDNQGIHNQWTKYKEALVKGKGDVANFLASDDFTKLTASQKKVFFDLISQEQAISTLAKQKAELILKENKIEDLFKKINEHKARGLTKSEIYARLSPEEIDLHTNALLAYQDLTDAIGNQQIDLKKAIESSDAFTNKKITVLGDHFISGGPDQEVFLNTYTTPSGSANMTKNTLSFDNKGFTTKTGGIVREVDYTLIDGTNIKKNVLVPNISVKEKVTTTLNTRARVENFLKSPDNLVSINIDGTITDITPQNFAALKDRIPDIINPADISGYTFKTAPVNQVIKPEFLNNYYLDPLDISEAYFDKIGFQFQKQYSEAVDVAYTTLSNQGFVDAASTSFIDYKMKQFVNANNPFTLLGTSLQAFAYNFGYWQVKRGGADIGILDSLGLDKFSIYRIPESYSSINITHQMSPEIYSDAYIDFFANDGSDQGDLFMKYLNSAIFIFPKLIKLGLEVVGDSVGFVGSAERSIDNMLRSKIKRDVVDNIVLFSDTINSGCGTNCRINIGGSEFIEQQTKEKSLSGLNESMYDEYMSYPSDLRETTPVDMQKIQQQRTNEKLANLDSTIEIFKKEAIDSGEFTEQEIQQIVDDYKKDMLQAIEEDQQRVLYETKRSIDPSLKLNINFDVPRGFSTNNYILENTTQKNYEDKGQTLVTFSHHTDYSGVHEGEKSEDPINLLKAIQDGETCAQKIRDLSLGGINIGGAMPKDYRMAVALSAVDRLAYWTLPAPGNPLLAPTLLISIPTQVIVMPQIKGCVDDQEGLYVHLFMNALEYERIENDPTNKVADAVDQGLDTIESTLKGITKNTEFEKTVTAGTNEAKGFVEKNFRDHAIVQSQFSTSSGTDSDLDGRLFFFELGPNTRCRANNLNDKGVEILIDENRKEGLEIDKEKGEMNLVDKDGNIKKIIKDDESDFVRLVATNLGIPAKIVPLRLTYLPVPDTNETLLFDMDVYGNLFVRDPSFMNCIREGYLAQTGNEIPAGETNLTEFLGAVKTANIINPLTQYDVYPQNTKITAQGTPRQVAEGTVSRLSVYGDRTSMLFPIEGISNKTANLGKNISIQFERGQLVYSGEKNAYIMWVEYTSVTSGADIDNLDAKLETIKADNGCEDEEIAIGFSATPKDDNPNSQSNKNVDQLNNALENVGPFQMFDTPTKTFIFYISDYPECEQRLKIIDKETGEIYDMKITNVKETPEGIFVETEDGLTHKFDFDAEHGVPKLKYNDEEETLLSAQGRNGGFWFDPQTGNWYTENGMMIPYNQAFRDGMHFATGADGKVTGTSGQNVFNIGSDGAGRSTGGFNIPLSPTTTLGLVIYVLFFVSCFYVVNTIILKPKKKQS